MRKKAPIRLTVVYPESDRERAALAELVAQIHADAVISRLDGWTGSAQQKLALRNAVIWEAGKQEL